MSEFQFICFVVLVAVWPVCEMVHEAYEFVVDEWIAWRLRRQVKKLYWFINWRK